MKMYSIVSSVILKKFYRLIFLSNAVTAKRGSSSSSSLSSLYISRNLSVGKILCKALIYIYASHAKIILLTVKSSLTLNEQILIGDYI